MRSFIGVGRIAGWRNFRRSDGPSPSRNRAVQDGVHCVQQVVKSASSTESGVSRTGEGKLIGDSSSQNTL